MKSFVLAGIAAAAFLTFTVEAQARGGRGGSSGGRSFSPSYGRTASSYRNTRNLGSSKSYSGGRTASSYRSSKNLGYRHSSYNPGRTASSYRNSWNLGYGRGYGYGYGRHYHRHHHYRGYWGYRGYGRFAMGGGPVGGSDASTPLPSDPSLDEQPPVAPPAPTPDETPE